VHVRGTLACTHDRDTKRQLVEQLTRHMESQRQQPWAVSDAPADYIEKMLQGLVGLTLTISDVVAKTKASQNRTAEDRRGVAEGLAAEDGAREAADVVRDLLSR
jgi:transcriptional regulator